MERGISARDLALSSLRFPRLDLGTQQAHLAVGGIDRVQLLPLDSIIERCPGDAQLMIHLRRRHESFAPLYTPLCLVKELAQPGLAKLFGNGYPLTQRIAIQLPQYLLPLPSP